MRSTTSSRAIMAAPEGSLTVCTLGPMTNLAMAMTMEPRIIPRIREVVLMGGGFFEGGNATPAAEFNIFVDPHAAHKVFDSGVPVTMAPIDCTYTAQMTPEWLDALRATGSRAAIEAANLADFYRRYGSPQIPDRGAADPRRLRHRLPARAGDLRAAKLQRDRRHRLARDDRHDRRRLVACDRAAQELQRAAADRSAAVLQADAGADRLRCPDG